MPILRLAYTTQFLIALIAVFVLWSQVGGQSHIDLMPWYFKLGLGVLLYESINFSSVIRLLYHPSVSFGKRYLIITFMFLST